VTILPYITLDSTPIYGIGSYRLRDGRDVCVRVCVRGVCVCVCVVCACYLDGGLPLPDDRIH